MNARLFPILVRIFPLLASFAGAVQAADWEPLPPLPEPNGGFVCGMDKNKIVIVGGTNWEGGKKNWLDAIHEYDPVAKTWTKVRELSHPLAYATAMEKDGILAWAGGSDGKQAVKEAGVVAGLQTSAPFPALPESMVLAAGGMVGGMGVMVGGTDDAAHLAGVQRSVHVLQIIDGRWQVRPMADYPGKPFAVAASAVVGDELLVFGGMNYDAKTEVPPNSTEAYAFAPAKNTWRKLQPLAVPARGLAAVVLDEQYIYLAGGYADDFKADAMIYDLKADSYQKAKPLPFAGLVALVKLGGFVYCLGGEDKKQSRTDKFFRIPVAELLK